MKFFFGATQKIYITKTAISIARGPPEARSNSLKLFQFVELKQDEIEII